MTLIRISQKETVLIKKVVSLALSLILVLSFFNVTVKAEEVNTGTSEQANVMSDNAPAKAVTKPVYFNDQLIDTFTARVIGDKTYLPAKLLFRRISWKTTTNIQKDGQMILLAESGAYSSAELLVIRTDSYDVFSRGYFDFLPKYTTTNSPMIVLDNNAYISTDVINCIEDATVEVKADGVYIKYLYAPNRPVEYYEEDTTYLEDTTYIEEDYYDSSYVYYDSTYDSYNNYLTSDFTISDYYYPEDAVNTFIGIYGLNPNEDVKRTRFLAYELNNQFLRHDLDLSYNSWFTTWLLDTVSNPNYKNMVLGSKVFGAHDLILDAMMNSEDSELAKYDFDSFMKLPYDKRVELFYDMNFTFTPEFLEVYSIGLEMDLTKYKKISDIPKYLEDCANKIPNEGASADVHRLSKEYSKAYLAFVDSYVKLFCSDVTYDPDLNLESEKVLLPLVNKAYDNLLDEMSIKNQYIKAVMNFGMKDNK